MKKKLLSLLLALVMVLTMLPATVLADEILDENPPAEDVVPDEVPEEELPEEIPEEKEVPWLETIYDNGEVVTGEEVLFAMDVAANDYAGEAVYISFGFRGEDDSFDFTGVKEAAYRLEGGEWIAFAEKTILEIPALEDTQIEFRIVYEAGGEFVFGYNAGTEAEGDLFGGLDVLMIHEDDGSGICKLCETCLHPVDENWWCTVEDCDHPSDCYCRESMPSEEPEEPETPEEPEEPEEPEKVFYTIYAEDYGHGDITPEGYVDVEEGKNQTFWFSPDKGYEVSAVYVDGVLVSEYGFWHEHYWNCNGCKDCWWFDWSEWLECEHKWHCDENHYHFPVCEWEEWGDGITFYDVDDNHYLYVEFSPIDDLCETERYWDLSSGAWYHEATDYVLSEGLMEGVGGNYFDPYGNTTRAQLVTMLYRLAGEPKVSGGSSFADVEEGSWYADAVIWAAKKGIVEGYGNGYFGVNDVVTREQTVAILYRYAAYKGCRITDLASLAYFLDAGSVSEYAVRPFQWAVGEEIVEGEPSAYGLKLNPDGATARVEMAAMIARYAQYLG